MATTDDTYNGWTNRETWAAALWLGNDQAIDTEARERAGDAIAAYTVRCAQYGFEPNDAGELNSAGEALRDFVDEIIEGTWYTDPNEAQCWARDIGSRWRVNWAEVAAAFAPEPVEA